MGDLREIERTEIEIEGVIDNFLRWNKSKRVELICFDIDDTLCKTAWIFDSKIKECAEYFESVLDGDKKNWQVKIEAANNSTYETQSVNPNKWGEVVSLVTGFKKGEIFDTALGLFDQIYTTPLNFTEGTEYMLEILSDNKVDMATVTHANGAWTERKYQEWLMLERFIPRNRLFVVDENGHKTAESWREATRLFKVVPRKILGVGDSARSDINPLHEIGVVHKVLVNEGSVGWSIQHQSVPNDVWKAKHAGDILYLGEQINLRKKLAI